MFALYPTTVQQFKLQRYKEFSKQLTQVGQHFKNENNKYKKHYGHPRSFFDGELSELHEGHPRLYKGRQEIQIILWASALEGGHWCY